MKNNYLPLILIATAFGLLAGAAGALFANIYSSSLSSFSLNRELNLSDYGYLSPNLVIRDPKKVVVNQDVKTDETIRSLRASLLGVFIKLNNKDAYYDLDRPFASALAATSDGWVMVAWPEEVTKATIDKISENFIVIDNARKIYEVDRVVADAEQTGSFIFLHLKNASGLNVRRLVPDEEIKAGQSLLLAAPNNVFLLNALSGKNKLNSLLSSDIYSRGFSLAYQVPTKNLFVFNLSGEIIGAVDYQGKQLSSPALATYWRSLLKSNSLSWPSLGVNYLDLATIVSNGDLPDKGAKLQGGDGLPAVVKNSPADKAGLMAGDIITRVNGTELNIENDLAVILSSYNAGDSISLDYSRNGASVQVEITLGIAK